MTKYYIVVYDVATERLPKVYKLLKKYLFWQQNSVFEGYLEENKAREMINNLKKLIAEEDSIIIYSLKSASMLDKERIGALKKEYPFVI